MTTTARSTTASLLITALFAAAPALSAAPRAALDDPPNASARANDPQTSRERDRDDPPTLDELLGLDPERTAHDPLDPWKQELDRRLSRAELGDALRQAITLMGDTAERLGDARDPGLTTQRMQEDILRRLDQVVSALEQMQQSGQSQPGQPQQDQQDQAGARPQPRPGQDASEAGEGDNRAEAQPPGRQDGPLRPDLEAARASWGALPDRVRQMLMQGSSDRFSSLYEAMTETYYRRLAEGDDR